ncbi:anaphase-promoting complex subunit 4 isoform X2 [Bicyclus anynana]|uniref:Anaphase-promoting complex subunit 4 n=1 Tax=Bicyclus anynana TaxID=110368 RepID=A0ABM3LFW2_BICAN|nr:anaphase-promoting complex subunit 4 isoform X2 [Bicyclus anynana]
MVLKTVMKVWHRQKGEVQVHRLHWQKVWNLPPPKENVSVDAMAWRPDGKALAIGYSHGSVYIVDIEDKEIIDKYDFACEISEEFYTANNYGIPCITWAVKAGTLESAVEYNLYDDPTIFLPKPPSPTNTYKNQATDDTLKCFKENQDQTQLSMLMIAYGSGNIYMSVFGRYPYGTVHLSHITKDECGEYKILDINLSDDFSVMQVMYLDTNNNIYLSLVNTSILSAYSEELFVVATRHSQIVNMMTHLDKTMISITEAWEHILLEMDTKMAYYASSVPEGGVSADLLELLMLGVPSDELEVFLLNELTAKGLKKFGNSVELSYSTIQKLVLKQLNIVGQSLTYYLAELRGLTRIPDRYKVLGLEEKMVTEAIKASCAFLNKCLELQQVIDVSMRNYKAFFRWLFVVIVRLLDEQASSEIVKITQQELTHIADFLYNFDNVQVENNETAEKPVKFNLERLGQYLQDQELSILPDDEDNPWHKYLRENSCLLKDNDTIFSVMDFRKFSLVQQQNHLKAAVGKIFDVKTKYVGKYFTVLYNLKCHQTIDKITRNNLRISQIFDPNEDRFMMAFTDTENIKEEIYFVSVNVKERLCNATCCKYAFSSRLLQDENDVATEKNLPILDLQFYSSEYLSVLVKHPTVDDSTVFIQVPLKIVLQNSVEFNMKSKSLLVFNEKVIKKNLSPLLDASVYKVLDKMDGFRIAVSGSRKVAVVLSNSHRKVRVFEMEINGEDEEDETLDTTPLSQTSQT